HLRRNKKYVSEFLFNNDFDEDFEMNIEEERSDNLPKEAYISKEIKELIMSFIENLPRRQKEVIILFYLEEFKIKEIADILDYNEGSIRSRLHSGRKNLELQVKEYQEEHHIELYSASIFSILGFILNEHCEALVSKQDLRFDKGQYGLSNTSFINSFIQLLTSKLMITVVIVSISVVAIIATSTLLNNGIDKGSETDRDISIIDDLEMYKKVLGNPYITDITYLKFPMRTKVEVMIKLKKDVSNKDIKILFNNEELSFERNEKDILVQVKENGIYTIVTNEYETSFKINNMDIYAPELVEVFNEKEYLLLIVNDEKSQIDYQKSYVEYQGKEYIIPKDLKVYGKFTGLVKITLFHHDGYFISYDLNFK
ncbi:MAG: RNA polymerase sigma factor, partial [Coprobacillaceae bacterium]